MPYYSLADIAARIAALDVEIAATEPTQMFTSGGPGAGMHTARGDLRAKYNERQFWIKEYDRIEAQTLGGAKNRARFGRQD